MKLSFRPAKQEDIKGIFRGCFRSDLGNSRVFEALKYEWDFLLENPNTQSMVVIDAAQRVDQIVGVAQIAFATDEFIQLAKSGSHIWINRLITETNNGKSKFLISSKEEFSKQNTEGLGLNAVVTRWYATDRHDLSEEYQYSIREYLLQKGQFLHRGLCLKEVIIEAIGTPPKARLERMGYKLLCDYHDFFTRNPPFPPEDKHPYLFGITKEEAKSEEGSHSSQVFSTFKPIFCFTSKQQSILELAIKGFTDEEIAKILMTEDGKNPSFKTQLNRIKSIWGSIRDKVILEANNIEDFKDFDFDKGKEMRSKLIWYLVNHMEEIRLSNTSRR